MANILVTGANGFVGRALIGALLKAGHSVRAALRQRTGDEERMLGCDWVEVGDIRVNPEWRNALAGCDVVVHLAARAHVLRDEYREPIVEYRRVNVAASETLARAAAGAGVRRLVFLSSIGVNGKATPDRPYSEADIPNPHDAYATSKWEAELALAAVARATGMELVVVRSPLVYGPGVRANFLRLLKLVDARLPLPFASVANRRSIIYIGNLADALLKCVERDEAAGQTFLISDGEDVSTPELIRRIAKALGVRPNLRPFPPRWLRWLAALAGRREEANRLLNSLRVDPAHIRRCLGWAPPVSMSEGLRKTADWYRQAQRDALARKV